jgi:hypothetical protein
MTQRATKLIAPLAALLVAGLLTGTAAAKTTAAPQNTSAPTIEGNTDSPFVGDTLRASRGSWSGSPTSYSYRWERCDAAGDRKNCVAISGATAANYTVQKADVNHKLHLVVTARNADGSDTADSQATGVVNDTSAPKSSVAPTVAGSAVVGSTLTANNGTWTGATDFDYQWQSCNAVGNTCTDITGATAKTYTVRTTDLGNTLRVVVTAKNKYGSTKATTDHTDVVTTGAPSQTTTTVVTTPAAGNAAPKVSFLSLKVRSNRVYVRFRVCDDSTKVTVIERDAKAHKASYTRRIGVRPHGCTTYSRNWKLIPRFRGHGKFTVSLRGLDSSRKLGRTVARSVRL